MIIALFISVLAEQPCPDLQKSKQGMDAYVDDGNWHCATRLIEEAHAGRVPDKDAVIYTARNAAARVKKEAESLLLLLDKKFALPTPIPCVYRMKQNETHFTAVSRFAKIWDGQSAKWSSYSTKGGKGQLVHTKDLPFEDIRINKTHADMSIIGEILNRRNEYTFRHKLFDHIIPQQSFYAVEFREASRSMQMSAGAMLPEIHWTFRKRVPRWWPRLTAEEFEGEWEDDSEHFGRDLARDSPLTCLRFFCPSDDSCVEECKSCAKRPISVKDGVCHMEKPPTITDITLWDTDGTKGSIAGKLTWNVDPYDTRSVQVNLIDSVSKHGARGGQSATIVAPWEVDVPSSKVVSATLTAVDYKGDSSSPVTHQFVDNVAATGSFSVTFADDDMREGFIAGELRVQFGERGRFTEVVAFYEHENAAKPRKLDLVLRSGKVRPGKTAIYYIERPAIESMMLLLSNRGSLQDAGYELAIDDRHYPYKPILHVGLDWSREKNNDVDIELRVSSTPAKKKSTSKFPESYQIFWGNGDVLADLGHQRVYRYKGPIVHTTIKARATNQFGTADSDEQTIQDIQHTVEESQDSDEVRAARSEL